MKRTLASLSIALVLAVAAIAQTPKAANCNSCCQGQCGQSCCQDGCGSCCKGK